MYKLIIFLVIGFLFQQILANEKLVTVYTSHEGLPEQSIYDCTQDSLGNMWFAANNGIIKYNGWEWRYIDTLYSANQGTRATFLKTDNRGILWIFPALTQSKIWYGTGEKLKSMDITTDSLEQIVSVDVSIIKNNVFIVLVTNQSKIITYYNNSFLYLKIDALKDIKINDCVIKNENILFATNKGLYRYNIFNKATLSISEQNRTILCIEPDANSNSFTLLGDSWIGEFVNNKIRIIDDVEVKYTDRIFNYAFVKRIDKRTIYYGTMFELYEYDSVKKKVFTLDANAGFATNGATAVFVDREKNTWITSMRGINKIRYSPFANYYASDGLLQNEVTAIEKFPNGPIVLGHNNGLTIWDRNIFRHIRFEKQLNTTAFPRVLLLQYDPTKDVVWFNSQINGIGYITRDFQLKWITDTPNNKNNSFPNLFVDDTGKLYYSSENKFYKFVNGDLTFLANEYVMTIRRIARYDSSHLLLASRTCLLLFDEKTNKSQKFTLGDNDFSNLYALYKLNNKEWLIGSYGGLLIFDGTSLKIYDKIKIDKPVFFIGKEDEAFWFGLMGGALRWNPETNDKKLFTTDEGLAGVETNRDAFLFNDGKVYIGTNKGLSVFLLDVYSPSIYKIKPSIQFLDLIDDNKFHYNLSDELALPFNQNNITLAYNCPSFVNEKQNKYSILIDNQDKSTTETISTYRNSYDIRNLAPGDYKIGISALNANLTSSDTLYTSTITIKQPFYFEGWFVITLIVISLTLTYTFYDFINRNKYSQKLELEVKNRTKQLHESERSIRDLTQKLITAQEKERERIARELHDNIAQDLAIIKTELEKYTANNKPKTIHPQTWVSHKVNELSKYVRDMAFFLHPNSIKQTGLLNAIQTLCSEYENYSAIKVDYFSNLSEPVDLDEEYQTNIYRFIQEGLTNIRKHSKASNAIVILIKRDDVLSIRVEDDGVGFNTNDIDAFQGGKKMGLKSMEERIRIMDGKLSIKSVEGEGTKVIAQIPLGKKGQPTSEANSDHTSGS